jgi:hypothetical protein
LKEQFDKVCDEMFAAIDVPNIDAAAGAETLARIAQNADKTKIEALLKEIASSTDKKKHVIY